MKSILIVVTVILLTSSYVSSAYAHGLGKETVGPKNIGDMLVYLEVNLQPEMRYADELVDMELTIKAIDKSTESTLKGVAYSIDIKKFYGSTMLRERFHAVDDTLKIVFKPEKDKSLSIEGSRDSMGYVSSKDESVVVKGNVFIDAGLYVLDIDVLAIGDDPLQTPVRFVSKITVSEHKTWRIAEGNLDGSIETISYFDTISTLNVSRSDSEIRIEAISNFNWDKEFVKDIPLLHFEYYIPKEFRDIADKEFKGYINGIEEPIQVDRAAEGYVVIHYMTPNSRLMRIADNVTDMRDRLVFTLLAYGKAEVIEPTPGMIDISSLEFSEPIQVKSSKGTFVMEFRYAPSEPHIDKPLVIKLKLYDADMNPVESMRYDIMLYDSRGEHIDKSHRSVQTRDTQIYSIDRPDTYKVVVTNINKSGESASFTVTVVPEFPVAVIVMGIALMGMLIIGRGISMR